MADNIPDFTNKVRPIDPMAIANILQRRGEIEQQQRNYEQQRRDQQFGHITDAIEAGQRIATNMMNLAEKRNQAKGLTDLTNLMSQPEPTAPAPMASSSALADKGSFDVQPSPEQNNAFVASTQARQKALTEALARANPEEFTKFASKAVFKPEAAQKALNLDPQDIMVDGVRTKAGLDKNTLTYYDVNTKQPIQGKITPVLPAGEDVELTDQDRKDLGPLAQSIIEGRASPSALVNARGNRKEKLSRIVAEKDPSFDLSLAPQRIATRRDFSSSGKSGQALTSLNTVIGHLDTMNTKLDKLDNKAIPKYNSMQNYVKNNIGKPEVKEFNSAKVLVVSELGKIAQGSGVVTNEERKQFDEQINAASSPEQVRGVVSTWMDLLKSRTDAMKSNWNQTMPGMTPPVPFINDKTKKILVKQGYNPDTLEKNGSNTDDQVNALFSKWLGK